MLDGQEIPSSKDAVDGDEYIAQKMELKITPAGYDGTSKHQVNRPLLVHWHVDFQKVPLSKQCDYSSESSQDASEMAKWLEGYKPARHPRCRTGKLSSH